MRVILTSDHHAIDGVKAPRFPVLVAKSTGVFEPAFSYLREQAIYGRRAPGSLTDSARIICIWLNDLRAAGRDWDEPCPEMFLHWALSEKHTFTVARRRHRAGVVFGFYEHLAREPMPSWQVETFVNELSEPLPAHVLLEGKSIKRRLRLRFGRSAQAMRPTPSEENVEAIATALLGSGSAPVRVRNWLIVQTALGTNLRVQGLAQLTIPHIDSMLREEGMLGATESVERMAPGPVRSRLRLQIERRRLEGRRFFLSPPIFEKGKQRIVRFPIPLVGQILEYIWTERWGVHAPPSTPNALWISRKGGYALKSTSISDILKNGFSMAGVAGSGHRIRATHCVRLFRDYVAESKRRGGVHSDMEVVLERVAQIMGHNRPETLRPYLHLVLLEQLVGEPV